MRGASETRMERGVLGACARYRPAKTKQRKLCPEVAFQHLISVSNSSEVSVVSPDVTAKTKQRKLRPEVAFQKVLSETMRSITTRVCTSRLNVVESPRTRALPESFPAKVQP